MGLGKMALHKLTLFRIKSTLPPASITAVSPRSDTTFPRMRTMRCWKFERWGARMRGVWGWSIVKVLFAGR